MGAGRIRSATVSGIYGPGPRPDMLPVPPGRTRFDVTDKARDA